VIRVALAVAALAAIAAGCGIERRSTAFACETSADCGSGVTCQQGWCVGTADGDGGTVDADPNAPDADPNFVCPAGCSRCDASQTCIISCDDPVDCPAVITCPADVACKVECLGNGACMAGIDCSAARSCRIECTADNTCNGAILCGSGVCRVECEGSQSCAGGIDCDQSCLCDTFCNGSGACAAAPTCPPPGQCTSGTDCTSAPGQCNTC